MAPRQEKDTVEYDSSVVKYGDDNWTYIGTLSLDLLRRVKETLDVQDRESYVCDTTDCQGSEDRSEPR